MPRSALKKPVGVSINLFQGHLRFWFVPAYFDLNLAILLQRMEKPLMVTRETSASAPQYIDCANVSSCQGRTQHSHTPQHLLDVYTTMLPLYVAATSEP